MSKFGLFRGDQKILTYLSQILKFYLQSKINNCVKNKTTQIFLIWEGGLCLEYQSHTFVQNIIMQYSFWDKCIDNLFAVDNFSQASIVKAMWEFSDVEKSRIC